MSFAAQKPSLLSRCHQLYIYIYYSLAQFWVTHQEGILCFFILRNLAALLTRWVKDLRTKPMYLLEILEEIKAMSSSTCSALCSQPWGMQTRVRSGEKAEQERNGHRPERAYGASAEFGSRTIEKQESIKKLFLVVFFIHNLLCWLLAVGASATQPGRRLERLEKKAF